MTAAETDEQLAERLATAAGAILLDLRARGGLDGKTLGKAGDERANAMLCREIRATRPADALLSEEEKDNPARCSNSRVWIIDPLDGTREYGEGRDDWAVHVALAVDGVATVGAVALPGLGVTLTSGVPVALQPANQPLRMLVSRTRPAAEAVFVAERFHAELLAMGSAGAKAMAVVLGQADIYLHTGGQYEWDNCAPVAVAQAAGLHVSRVDGSPIRYNNPDTYLPDLLICRKELAEEVLRVAAEYSSLA
ncbi:3'-phosphoadenosine 5'-phosphate phosphatase [uncultured Sphingopyxis sp.]|uniref:3'-phosphoadenosine 5'-phosphate phosphatase n=1 Tax=uncultured Sphingopyxis sp. TaxID=310581 RepID=A0A1Y5PS73_9SPHN|nr:3'(2'),5'-bisphosphate nucleotidase CysQ [uncultured Sphingopyxis sp.]SBV32831.1 3'-phosphoadenosine 5'-phosphate phosphatase [uncultured Sphingopyxis sp.]